MHDFIWEGEIDLDVCDKLIEFYETCTYLPKVKYDGKGHSKGKESTDMHCHTMLAKNEKILDTYMLKLMTCLSDGYCRTYPQAGQIACHVHPMFNIQRYKPGEGYSTWHFERGMERINRERFLVWMTYLSDNPEGQNGCIKISMFQQLRVKPLYGLQNGHIPIEESLTRN